MTDRPDEALERVKRFIKGETCRTIYRLPPSGRMDPLRADTADLLSYIAQLEARVGEVERERDEARSRLDHLIRGALDAWEDRPCSLCDTSGRCTFACKHADSVAPPSLAQCFGALEAADARIRALVEGLRPFAEYGRIAQPHESKLLAGIQSSKGVAEIRGRDLRRAAKLTESENG